LARGAAEPRGTARHLLSVSWSECCMNAVGSAPRGSRGASVGDSRAGDTMVSTRPEAAATEVAPLGGAALVVDDEPLVRRIACKILEGVFSNVLEASSGRQALEIAEAYHEEITLLLTDVIMPGMGGRELSETFRERRPGTMVLFMSAYTE